MGKENRELFKWIVLSVVMPYCSSFRIRIRITETSEIPKSPQNGHSSHHLRATKLIKARSLWFIHTATLLLPTEFPALALDRLWLACAQQAQLLTGALLNIFKRAVVFKYSYILLP